MAEAILGNVSFFLYCRQCRYYAPAILATSALAFLYVFWDGRRRSVAAFALLSVVLLAANYLNYVALYACLAADYLIWGRKRRPLTAGDWLWLIFPQVLLGTPIVLVWNPLGKVAAYYQTANWLADKVTLFCWNWRDLNQCEFGVVHLIVLAPLIYARTRWDGLLRLPLAAFIYVVVITIASPQPVGLSRVGCRCPIPGGDDPPLHDDRCPLPPRDRPQAHPGRFAGNGRIWDEPGPRGAVVRLGFEVDYRIVCRKNWPGRLATPTPRPPSGSTPTFRPAARSSSCPNPWSIP